MLFLPCSGSSARQWAPVVAALGDDMDATALDLIGYGPGAPAWPVGVPCSLDDEALRLAPWLRDGPQVHLVGHSFGATVALQLALRWPSRVASLTLYEPVRFALLFGDPETRAVGDAIVQVGRQIGREVQAGNSARAAELFIDYWSGAGTWAAMTPRHQAGAAARMPKVHAEFEALFADPVPLDAYRQLALPTLLLVGGATLAPPREVARRLASALPCVRCQTLPGLGHMGPITDAALIAARIGAFLDSPAVLDAALVPQRPRANVPLPGSASVPAVKRTWIPAEDRAAPPSHAAR